jgi:hypothetical protein
MTRPHDPARAHREQARLADSPGLSLDQNVAVACGMALFRGFAWPWILVAMHKRPVRRLMERLIADVDAEAASGAGTLESA